MASVFLSYDREDSAKAGSLARLLEKAGHSVWWDRHIKGGAEFGREIEQALNRAEAVVVLWSEQSVESAWVRDEAAVGRESGRLVPVLIEAVQPPMGFRQYQNIDLASWKGRGRPSRLADLLASVEAMPGETPRNMATAEPKRRVRQAASWIKVATGIAVAIFTITGLFFVLREPVDQAIPTVAVAAADPAAEPLARDLLVKLATLQSATSGSMRLSKSGTGNRQYADLLFEIGGDARAPAPVATLVLTTGKDQTVLWSDDLAEKNGGLADLKQRAAFTSARVLGCALDGMSHRDAPLAQDILKLYLSACALLGKSYSPDSSEVIPILQKVIEHSPAFKPAWAKLLVAQTNEYQDADVRKRPSLGAPLRRSIAGARKIDPNLPEAYLAELELVPAPNFYKQIDLADRALAAGPDNAFVLSGRSLALLCVGRMEAAIDDARRAEALDPLSPAVRNAHIEALAFAGKTDAARSKLAEAERLWPGASSILRARFRFNARIGDPADALGLIRSGTVEGDRGLEAFIQARIQPTPQNIDRAIQLAMANPTDSARWLSYIIQALGQFGKTDDLIAILLKPHDQLEIPYIVDSMFRPSQASLRADPRFMLVAARFGLLDYWRRSGDWPDFCSDPDLPYNCKQEAAKLSA